MKSVKTKGILFSLCLIVFTIVIVISITYFQCKQILVNEVENAVTKVAEESADHLNRYLDQFVAPLKGIARDPRMVSMNWKIQKNILESQISPNYLSIAVVDQKRLAHYIDGTEVNLMDREYVKAALMGALSFSDLITSRKTGQKVYMVGMPIINGKQVVGALIARLDVDFLANFAKEKGYGTNGVAFVFSDKGTLVSGSNVDANYLTIPIKSLEENTRNQQSGHQRFEYKDTSMLTGFAKVKGTTWTICVATPEKDALQAIQVVKRLLIVVALLSLVLSAFAAWIFMTRFAKPIRELDRLFSQGAKGNLNIRYLSKSKDEFGRVGMSFNRMMDKLKTLTQYDPLTGLLNQYVLEIDIKSLVEKETPLAFTVIMFGIDKFSLINETYGYSVGDKVLQEAAKRMESFLGKRMRLYRYKGDEFVVLIPSQGSDELAMEQGNLILLELLHPYQMEEVDILLNVSGGAFVYTMDAKAKEPLKAVTNALNYAKNLGGCQMHLYSKEIHDNLLGMRALQGEIVDAVEGNEFFLVFQPLLYLENEKLAEVEVLIRWKHKERGILFPDEFIELAEQNESIIAVDMWVLHRACEQLEKWILYKKQEVVVSVNVTAKTFESKEFCQRLAGILEKYHIKPGLLQLEITERVVIRDVEESIRRLNQVRKMGVRIAIDDFGIGYSSLSYIVRLPVDCLKIDREFVKNVTHSKQAKVVISTIIRLCKELKLNVIAEGIETVEEFHYLRNSKCHVGQGYYFDRPMDLLDLEEKYIRGEVE